MLEECLSGEHFTRLRRVTYLVVFDGEENETLSVLPEEGLIVQVLLARSNGLLVILGLLDEGLDIGVVSHGGGGCPVDGVVLFIGGVKVELLDGGLDVEVLDRGSSLGSLC